MSDTSHSPASRLICNGVEIVYDTFGEPSSAPLLLIAGHGNQMIDWKDEFCSQLADEGYWVIRFDNRDAGLSTSFDDARTPNRFLIGSAYVWGTPIKAAHTLYGARASLSNGRTRCSRTCDAFARTVRLTCRYRSPVGCHRSEQKPAEGVAPSEHSDPGDTG